MHTIIWSENLKRRYHSEDLNIDGRKILECILPEIQWKIVGWIHLAQDRDQCWALVSAVMKLQIP